MEIPLRPLDLVKNVVEGLGLAVSYVYDDLVFVEHNAFLLQFGDQGHLLGLYFNTDCPEKDQKRLAERILATGRGVGLEISHRGSYSLSQDKDDSMSLEFF